MNNLKILSIVILIIVIIAVVIYYVTTNLSKVNNKNTEEKVGEPAMASSKYIHISASEMVEQIKNMKTDDYVILDVRTKQEYDEERIPNSVLLTLNEIGAKASNVLPNKDIRIYVYCRSGARSQQAAHELINLGYTNVYDMGGIIDYPYDKIKGKN